MFSCGTNFAETFYSYFIYCILTFCLWTNKIFKIECRYWFDCRVLPDSEVESVSTYLKQLLTCDTNALPTDTFVHVYLKNMPTEFLSTSQFLTCMTINQITVCSQSLYASYCGTRFGQGTENRQAECQLLMKVSYTTTY